jgi:CRISPR-associated protein Csd1
MILEALYNYYKQQSSDPERMIATEGFEWKEIPFVIVIDRYGNFIALDDTRDFKMKRSKTYLVPKSIGRSGSNSWMTSFLLWDHYGYVLGHPKGDDIKSIELAKKQLYTFFEKIKSLPEPVRNDDGVGAIISFYNKKESKKVYNAINWKECQKIIGCNMSFRLDVDSILIPCRQSIRSYIESQDMNYPDEEKATCLLTGMYSSIARIHGDTPINKDSKKIVSFQRNSGYDSYGKEQAYNAPTSKAAEFAYTTALNALLARDSRNKIQLGDITIVFWSERKNAFEYCFPSFFSFPKESDPESDVKAVSFLEKNISSPHTDEFSNRFFVLGLGPNAARISVKLWVETTVGQIQDALQKHYDDVDIIRSVYDTGHYSVFWLLSSLSVENRIENIPSNLGANIIRSIITGDKYPVMMLQQTIMRIRTTRSVRRMQAGILKAYLNRSGRVLLNNEKERIYMSLDETNISMGYLLGRLFAVLEKIQENAIPGINGSLRDRYYGSASSMPMAVFPRLFKLKNYYLDKMKIKGLRNKYEKLLTDIINRMPPDMPRQLSMEDQARFAIGYYHQKSDFNKSLIL